MSGSSQGTFRQLTKLPSATADSDTQVGLGIRSSFTKPSLSGHFLCMGRCDPFACTVNDNSFMTMDYIDNVIELNCSKVDITNNDLGIQILFSGENDLDYFLIQRSFDEDGICDFYTEGCDTTGWWTFIHATLNERSVAFSVDKMPIRVHLDKISKKQISLLRQTLRELLGFIGRLTENQS